MSECSDQPNAVVEDEFYYDEAAGELIIEFAHFFCTHIKGEWAGKPIILDEWEKDFLRNLFGWKRKKDGLRKYRTGYLEVPRKNGKSLIGAIVALFLLLCDNEPSAEVYGAANDREQARLVFAVAAAMVRNNPELNSRCKVYRNSITVPATESAYLAISADAKTKDGYNASGFIYDEVHEAPNRKLYDKLRTSMGARRQPMELCITTAGQDENTLCGEIHEYCLKIQKGIITDHSFYGVIYAADKDDDWTDPRVWSKANPGLGSSVKLEYLQKMVNECLARPSSINTFKRLHLNIWTNEKSSWIPYHVWMNAKAKEPYQFEAFKSNTIWIAIDLSKRIDLTAAAIVWMTEKKKYRGVVRCYLPEETRKRKEQTDRVPYQEWIQSGFIHETAGDVVDYDTVKDDILSWLSDANELKKIGIDPWNSIALQNALLKEELPVVEVRQGWKTMSPIMKEVEAMLMSRQFEHNDNPVLNWMVSNTVIKEDPSGNIRPDKSRANNRIDGVVALLMALGLAMQDMEEESVYNERGLIII